MGISVTEFKELSRRLQKLEAEIISIHRLLNQKGISPQANLNESNGTQEQKILAQLFEDGIWRKATDDEKSSQMSGEICLILKIIGYL